MSTSGKSKLTKSNQTYVDNLTKTLQDGVSGIELSLNVAKEPFETIEKTLVALEQRGRTDLVDKALAFNKTVAADVDTYTVRYNELKNQVTDLLAEPPVKARKIGEFAQKALPLGQQILALNQDIINTAVTLSDDYIRLIKEVGIEE